MRTRRITNTTDYPGHIHGDGNRQLAYLTNESWDGKRHILVIFKPDSQTAEFRNPRDEDI